MDHQRLYKNKKLYDTSLTMYLIEGTCSRQRQIWAFFKLLKSLILRRTSFISLLQKTRLYTVKKKKTNYTRFSNLCPHVSCMKMSIYCTRLEHHTFICIIYVHAWFLWENRVRYPRIGAKIGYLYTTTKTVYNNVGYIHGSS